MEPNWYNIITECVEDGIQWGIHHSYKHTDDPTKDQLAENIDREIMNLLSEKIIFPNRHVSACSGCVSGKCGRCSK